MLELLTWDRKVRLSHSSILCACKGGECLFCKALKGDLEPYVKAWRVKIGKCGCKPRTGESCLVCHAEADLALTPLPAPQPSPLGPRNPFAGQGLCSKGLHPWKKGHCPSCHRATKREWYHQNQAKKKAEAEALAAKKRAKAKTPKAKKYTQKKRLCAAGHALLPHKRDCKECAKITVFGLCKAKLHPLPLRRRICGECLTIKRGQEAKT